MCLMALNSALTRIANKSQRLRLPPPPLSPASAQRSDQNLPTGRPRDWARPSRSPTTADVWAATFSPSNEPNCLLA